MASAELRPNPRLSEGTLSKEGHPPGSLRCFELDFCDEDVTTETRLDGLCFDDPNLPDLQCGGPLPACILHGGVFDGMTGNGSGVTVEFTLVP